LLRQGFFEFALLAVILVAMVLVMHDLGERSLYQDELVLAQRWEMSAVQLLKKPAHVLTNLINHFLIAWFDKSEFIVRLTSAVAGILAIPVLYQTGRMMFGMQEGLLAALFLSLSPFYRFHSQEAKYYSLLLLFSLLSLLFLYRALTKNDKKSWFGFAFSTILNLYNHYSAFFVLSSEAIFAGLFFLRKRQVDRGARTHNWRSAGGYLLGLVIFLAAIGIFYIPRFPALRAALGKAVQAPGSAPLLLLLHFCGEVLNSLNSVHRPADYLLVGLFLLGLLSSKELAFLPALLVAVPLAFFLITGPGPQYYAVRFFIYLLPVYLLFVARGTTTIGQWFGRVVGTRYSNSRFQRLVPGIVPVIVGGIYILSLGKYATPAHYIDWKGAIHYLKENVRPGDVIIQTPAPVGKLGISYYFGNDIQNVEWIYLNSASAGRAVAKVSYADRGVWWVIYPSQVSKSLGKYFIVKPFENLIVVQRSADSRLHVSVVDDAIRIIQKCIQQFRPYGERPEVKTRLQQLYTALGAIVFEKQDFAGSIPDHERVATTTSGGSIWLQLGQAYVAQDLTGWASEIQPDRGWYHLLQGDAFIANEQADEALTEYVRAVTLNPDYREQFWYQRRLGDVYRLAGETEKAIDHYQQALSGMTDHQAGQVYLELGGLFRKQGDLAAAVAAYRQALVIMPDSAHAWSQSGQVYLAQGQPAQAAEAFQEAINLRPDLPWYRYLLAEAYRAQGQWDQALATYQSARADLEHPHIYRGLALTYEALGDTEQAIAMWEHMLTLQPEARFRREAAEHLARLRTPEK